MDATSAVGPVYRYLREERHAENFSRGRDVRISSISTCRKAEGFSGDSAEASMTYRGHIEEGSSSNPDMREILRRSGVSADLGITMKNVATNITFYYADAFLLCCTREMSPVASERFGPFCVRINHPSIFVKFVAARLLGEVLPIGSSLNCGLGFVTYGEREYAGLSAPRPAMFVKSIKDASEREVRMIWSPKPAQGDLRPVYISAPELSGLCTRME